MRQIKFRGKCLDNGEWVFGDLIHRNDGRIEICTNLNTWSENPACVDAYGEELVVNPDTIGQFTGLHDKNGKEVYEGDIIKYDVLYTVVDDIIGIAEAIAVIEWHQMGFILKVFENDINGTGCYLKSDQQTEIEKKEEVIGNIHDNPELIKREKE